MIKLQELTPEVYYNHSRDFQFIGRLYDIVLNSVKTNTGLIYNLPVSANSDTKLIDLMTLTLGFKSKHNYNIKQLTALCSAFVEVIRDKGSIVSIRNAGNTLLNAEGITQEIDFSVSDDKTTINIFLPQGLTDINLFKDLLNYILPAGMSCNIIKEFRVSSLLSTEITTSDTVKWKWDTDYKLNNNELSKWNLNKDEVSKARAGKTSGLLSNSLVWRRDKK